MEFPDKRQARGKDLFLLTIPEDWTYPREEKMARDRKGMPAGTGSFYNLLK